jgi:hypothetical protein
VSVEELDIGDNGAIYVQVTLPAESLSMEGEYNKE